MPNAWPLLLIVLSWLDKRSTCRVSPKQAEWAARVPFQGRKVSSVGQRKRRYDCLAMDTEVDHSAGRFRHVYFVGCDRASRALPNCVESYSLRRGRITVRTRFDRTLPIVRKVSL